MAKRLKPLNYDDVPTTLQNHVFFGLQLDQQQKQFRDAIWNPDIDIVFVNARAGTGKTTIAVATSVLMYKYGLVKGINYIISANAQGRQGYIPGTMQEKTAPYLQGLWSALQTANEWPERAIKGLNTDNDKQGMAYITAQSSSYLRGANIGGMNKKIMIIDQAENFTVSDLRKTLTRACTGTKVIVIGHTLQCDIDPRQSGFTPCMNHFRQKDNPRFAFIELNTCHRGLIAQTADQEW